MVFNWKDCTLGDVITLQRGFDLPSSKRQDGKVPVVSSSGISGYHNVAKVKAPGVVTGRYGTLGEVFYIDQDFWPLNTTLYIRNFKGNDHKFINYFLKTLNLAHQNAAGAVPGLNRNALHLLPVKIPPLPTQKKIAAILSGYDDLIENNTRRIKILEEMAQTLYHEWFVKFRFPGHEHTKMVDSELGLIPEGWEVTTIGNIAEVGRGSSPRPIADTKYFEGGTIPWIKIADATKSGKYLYETKERVNEYGASFSRLMHKGSIIVAASGTLGYTQILGVNGCIHDGWLYLTNYKSINKEYVYFVLISKQKFFYNSAYGAAIQNVNTTILREMKILLPPIDIQNKFTAIIDKFDKLIDNLGRKNLNLRKTRDLLLPKLISGEIDVERLNITTEDIAA